MMPFQWVKNIRTRLRNLIDSLLEHSHDYFLCCYPGNTGLFTRRLIRRLVNKLDFDDQNIKKIQALDRKSIFVYAGKDKRFLDFIYYHTKLKNIGLPYPQIGFDFRFFFLLPVKRLFQVFLSHLDYFLHHFSFKDAYTSNYIVRELLNGKAGFISLIEEEDFYKRFIKSSPDPIFVLIELQKSTDKSIIIVPENIIYISKPMRSDPGIMEILFGTHEKPGIIKRLMTVIRNPKKIKVAFAAPVDLKEYLSDPSIEQLDSESQAHTLRRHLVDVINRQRKSVTGPVLKSRQEITEDILTRKQLREYLAEYASEHNISLQKTHKEAAVYIKEIAANYNMYFINFGAWILSWVFKTLFDELIVRQAEIDRMREASTKAPLILVPCHKSHLDYLLLPYIMFHNNMPCPHIAAGKNLSFWPLGPLFRRGGAFFIRRTFKGAPLYSKIFSSYLEKLLYEGFNIKIFIEGGRSRTGKLLAPRPGGLGMLINAYQNGACSDLYFVPIFVGYDRVLEEDAYLKEIEGGKKNPETLKGLISARKFLKKKYGKVYMRFDEPISIKEYIREKNVDLSKMPVREYMKFVKNFGYKLINSINEKCVATPHGILASAILNCPKNSFPKRMMTNRLNTYMNILIFLKAELSDSILIDPDSTFDTVTRDFIASNFIELADEDEEDMTEHSVFIIKNSKRAILDYYKNSVINFFVSFAYTATAILETDRLLFAKQDLISRYKFLEELFIDEFFFDETTSHEQEISKALEGFVSEGILVPDPSNYDMYTITSQGLRQLKWFAAFLLPFFESYKTVLHYFEKYGFDKYEGKDRVKKIHATGIKLYKTERITLKESLSQINYKNAANHFSKMIAKGKDKNQLEQYKKIIDQLITLI